MLVPVPAAQPARSGHAIAVGPAVAGWPAYWYAVEVALGIGVGVPGIGPGLRYASDSCESAP